jgi:hypothetical protein
MPITCLWGQSKGSANQRGRESFLKCIPLLSNAQKEELPKALDKKKADMKEKNKKPGKGTPATELAE